MMAFKTQGLVLLLILVVSLVVTAHAAAVQEHEKRTITHSLDQSYQQPDNVVSVVSRPEDAVLNNEESSHIVTTRQSPASDDVPNTSIKAEKTVDNFGISDDSEDHDVVMKFSADYQPSSDDIVAQLESEESLKNIEILERSKHGDLFMCPPCNCSHTNIGYVIANCTNPRLSDLPDALPADTYRVYLRNTTTKTFDVAKLLQYTQLFQLFVNHNTELRTILFSTVVNSTNNITEMDFNSNNIQTIKDSAFIFMPKLLILTLNHNQLHTITNLTFEGLGMLRTLNLSANNISKIEPGAFIHMKPLRTLDLSRNEKLGYSPKHFHPELFKPLQRLQNLYIQGNSMNDPHYPHEVLGHLFSLTTLHIDGKNENFRPVMMQLTQFKTLQLGFEPYYCMLKELKASFFVNIPYIESLSLDHCYKLHQVESDAYSNATNLKKLSISHTKNYHLNTAFDDLISLQNSSLKSLAFIHLYHTALPCQFLFAEQSKYLKNIELEVLDLSDNRLALLGDDFNKGLPRTLKQLILRKNRLSLVAMILTKIHFLTKLRTLDLTGQNSFSDNRLPYSEEEATSCPHNPTRKTTLSTLATSNAIGIESESPFTRDNITFDEDITAVDVFGQTIDTDIDLIQNLRSTEWVPGKPIKLGIPPNLRYLIAPQFYMFGMVVFRPHFHAPISLAHIDFSHSLLSGLRDSDVMPRGIERANLAGNYFKRIGHSFFPTNNSLMALSLQNNILGQAFADDQNGTIFGNLWKTIQLDISMNLIFKLPRDFFIGLISLRTLSVSENRLQVLNTSFRHMKSLNYIDFSKNSITWITPDTRDDLDFLASPSGRIKLDLTRNPLPCTCAGLDIIYWMATSNIHFLNGDFLVCRLENGEITYIGNLEHRLRSLQRHCATKSVIIISCIAAMSVFIFLVIFATMYRFRWKLRYFRNIAMAKVVGFKPKGTRARAAKFDAYFLYSDESRRFVMRQCRQELEVKRGHRLCLADRDFMPGTFEAQAIVSAVQNSSKTIPVVTPDFYEEEYSEYAVKMAIMEELFEKRSVLHLCVYQPMPDDKMSKCHDLLMVMKRNDYTEFPPEDQVSDEVRQNFWDQLSRVIGHEAAEEIPAECDNRIEHAGNILP